MQETLYSAVFLYLLRHKYESEIEDLPDAIPSQWWVSYGLQWLPTWCSRRRNSSTTMSAASRRQDLRCRRHDSQLPLCAYRAITHESKKIDEAQRTCVFASGRCCTISSGCSHGEDVAAAAPLSPE